jgi:DNA-binding response OmpR family regulator
MDKPKILLVDDTEEILSANEAHLVTQGFAVTCANTGIKALAYLNVNHYDCIVLDILLPDLDGFAICKAARTVTDTPILFLSCLDEPDDKVKGLIAGGDDYMAKPYSLKELTARIQTIIRRGERTSFAGEGRDFYIDRENKIIRACGKNILLSEKEFNLFMLFYESPETVFSKESILAKIWRNSAEIGIVAVWISKLRKKLDFAAAVLGRIESKYGTGYCLIPPDSDGSV